jgi:outer membrane protein
MDSTEADLKEAVQDVMLDVWKADQSLRTALHSLAATDDLLKSARESFEAAHARYDSGVGSILDVLTAQSSLEDAQKVRIQAFSTWHMAKIRLAAALGNIDLLELE